MTLAMWRNLCSYLGLYTMKFHYYSDFGKVMESVGLLWNEKRYKVVKKSQKTGGKWEKVSRKQPIVVYKYVNNKIVDTKRFSTIAGKGGAIEWLRNQGCKFGNKMFSRLGNESIEFPVDEITYFEAECDAAPSQAIRRKSNGSVEV